VEVIIETRSRDERARREKPWVVGRKDHEKFARGLQAASGRVASVGLSSIEVSFRLSKES